MLIDQIAAFGCPVLLFSGGEPLLREDLFELMEYARQRKLRTVLSTNGTRITESVANNWPSWACSTRAFRWMGRKMCHDRFSQGSDGGVFGHTQRHCFTAARGIRTGLRLYDDAEQYRSI